MFSSSLGVIADAFSKMDLDNSGFISRENLTELMRSASDDSSGAVLRDDQLEETVDRMLSEGDLLGDGEFCLVFTKNVWRIMMFDLFFPFSFCYFFFCFRSNIIGRAETSDAITDGKI